jgi:hypothetical protein
VTKTNAGVVFVLDLNSLTIQEDGATRARERESGREKDRDGRKAEMSFKFIHKKENYYERQRYARYSRKVNDTSCYFYFSASQSPPPSPPMVPEQRLPPPIWCRPGNRERSLVINLDPPPSSCPSFSFPRGDAPIGNRAELCRLDPQLLRITSGLIPGQGRAGGREGGREGKGQRRC